MSTTPTLRRRLVAVSCAAAIGASLGTAAFATTDTSRLAGTTRFGTAVATSQATFPSADVAIVARGRDAFPDALAASYVSGQLQAPILLTETNALPAETSDELARLGVSRVIIAGGTAAVSADVEDQLDASYDVTRLAGTDRYQTAARLARFASTDSEGASNVGTLGTSGPTALVTTGENFPDALAGGAVSFAGTFPILLTRPDALPNASASALADLGIEHAIVLGGTAAVSGGVAAELRDMGISVRRLGGTNRYETATTIADFATDLLGFTAQTVTLARGDLFPDALAAGPYAGFFEAPIVLTADPNTLADPTRDYLRANADVIDTITVTGGTAAVSDAVLQRAANAAD